MTLTAELREKLQKIIQADQASDSPKLQIKDGNFIGMYHPFVSVGIEQKQVKDIPPRISNKDGLAEIQIFFLGQGQEKNLVQLGWKKLGYPEQNEPKGVTSRSRKTTKKATNEVEGDK